MTKESGRELFRVTPKAIIYSKPSVQLPAAFVGSKMDVSNSITEALRATVSLNSSFDAIAGATREVVL